MQNKNENQSNSQTSPNLKSNELRVLKNITKMISEGNAAHSFILEGGSNSARLRVAQAAACAIICTAEIKKDGMPCFSCTACKKVLCNEHTDIKIIAPEKESGKSREEIRVDAIRAIIKDAYVLPTDCDYHIYIISESEKMNANAQNALLKILEEPPENTIFFLLTPSKELLLQTVISRAQSHKIGNSTPEDAEKILKEKLHGTALKNISEKTLARAARIQCEFDKIELDETAIKNIDNAYNVIRKYYIEKKHRIIEDLPQNKDELVLTLSLLAAAARDIAIAKRAASAPLIIFEHGEEFEAAQNTVSLKRALELYESFSKAAERIQAAGNMSSITSELFSGIRK